MNGMNGGANMAAAAAGGLPGPTPAGHQAELNYIYGMVEELSRQLAENRRVTEDIVGGLGRVRNRARSRGMVNDDVIGSAAEEIGAQERNLDTLISILSESLEKAKYSRDANATLLSQYASALAVMTRQLQEYKLRHVADVAAWHHSYRAQLDEARRENSRLREQVWDMQAHAGRANETLRRFRRLHGEDEARHERRVDERALRQELRFWKRMAMPEMEEDDPYWSDDDDVVDPAEKERLVELEHKAQQEQLMHGSGAGPDLMSFDGDEQQHQQQQQDGVGMVMGGMSTMMGGVPMQRDESASSNGGGGGGAPMLPARPMSAASSTGSTREQ